jgi:thermitase
MGVLLALTLAGVLVTSAAAPSDAISQEGGQFAEPSGPHDVLVKFDDEAGAGERAATRRAAGTDLEELLPLRHLQLVDPRPGVSVSQAVARLERSPHVLYAEPDLPRVATAMANDSYFALLWGLHNTGQSIGGRSGTADADIDAPEAWDSAAGNSSIAIAVVDSGVDYAHPDLQPNIWRNPGESGGGRESNGADDDGNGLIDDWRGWDWVDADNAPADLNGHGTHVAGTAGARGGDGYGVTGVAWQVGIVPLRVLDADGSGWASDVAAAFDWAGDRAVPVVNASLGSAGITTAERLAIREHPETLYVVAAGNDGDDLDVTPQYPCAYSEANVLCVGATDLDDDLAGFSNYGATAVDLFAPGVAILSAYPTGLDGSDGHELMSGTSMATPHVAGAAALVAAHRPEFTAAQVKAALMETADAKPALAGKARVGGRLNASAALHAAPPAPTSPPTPAPTSTPAPTHPPTPAPPAVGSLRISGPVVVCTSRRCRPRVATLGFVASAATNVTVSLRRRSRSGWQRARTTTVTVSGGSHRWRVSRRVAGLRLRPGRHEVTLTAPAGPASIAFAVRTR